MSDFGEKLESAINEASINYFVWKGAKTEVDGQLVQEEVRLIDMTEEQLNNCYDHCLSMLNSTDKTNPGRRVLLNIIKDQRARCNAELAVRYLEGSYLPDVDRIKYQRFNYLQSIREFMSNNPETFSKEMKSQLSVTAVTNGLPSEFHSVSIDMIESACLYTLGMFDKKHITLTFITKLGLWFDAAEKKELTEEAKKTGKTRLDIVKERLGLKPSTNIKLKSKGLLNYKEFRAMINLKNKKYSDLNSDQLRVLRNKVLFALEDEVQYHINQWLDRMDQIEKVAKAKGITLKHYDDSSNY